MASGGFSRLQVLRRARRFALPSLLLACAPVAARAADASISIPATTLDAALMALARQTGADIVSTEPGLARTRVAALSGKLSLHAALDRLLAGSGYRAVAIDSRSYRIVARPRPRPRDHRPAVQPPPGPTDTAQRDILVTASKQRVTLLRFPGSIQTISDATLSPNASRTPDMDDLARATPVLQSTELGPGRNKIFIRGIADSSFNGPTQSTASIYFGDVQLGYSGPEPALKLYDMNKVVVLEGPQGTLYGAGAIGGVIRLTPNPVDLSVASAAAASGVTATRGGGLGFDLAGRINLPIATDLAGLRLVAYRTRDGGYIDDPSRGLNDVNRTDTVGGRITFRVDPGDAWSVEVGGLTQQIDGQDAQYSQASVGSLAHQAALAQPFHSDFALGRVVITKKWDSGLQLLSATGVVDYHASDLFDATPSAPIGVTNTPILYRTDGSDLLLTHETRLSRSLPDGDSWVVGFTLLRDRDAEARALGPAGNPADIIGVTNVTGSASLFGESTFALTPAFSLTLGARLTNARTDGDPSTEPGGGDFIQGRVTFRLDPTGAFSWLLAPRLAMFGRLQSGYRTGGLAVARGVGRVEDFRSDSILVGELGFRLIRNRPTGIAASASVSYARWIDIQADLVNRFGQPFTANIGNARIQTIEGNIDWIPMPGLRATAAFLFTHNRVTGPLADLSPPAHRRLPDTPPFAGNLDLFYKWSIGTDSELRLGATANYVGRSVLGTGDLLDISQGQYMNLGLTGGWKRQGVDVSLTIDNLTNQHDNRFAYGNPFTLYTRDQATPLRPFNVRAGVAFSW
jgi:iron complex outermembrane receptor protein